MSEVDYLAAALELASMYHANQKDKAGRSYMEHICAVVAKCRTPDAKIVAALHDIIEDTSLTVYSLEVAYPKHIVNAVVALTRDKSVPYDLYIDRIADNELAREVKIADLEHNADLSRLPNPTAADRQRQQKYFGALDRLTKGAGDDE